MNRGANSGGSITHTAKKPNETTSEETAAAVSRFQSAIAIASILKSGHSERPTEYHLTGHGRAGMGFLNEYLNLGGVAAAEPEQEAHETRGR